MFEAIREMLENPAMKHAAAVHWPIVLSALAVPVALVSAVWCGKNAWLRAITLVLFVMFTLTTFIAINAGQAAEGKLGDVPAEVHDVVHQHEEAAQPLGIAGIAATLLAALVFIPKKPVRIGAAWLVVVVSALIGWRITIAAHYGGEAVYEYGAGIPNVSYASNEDGDLVGDTRVAFFQTQVKPIIDDNCLGCHGSKGKHPFKLSSFDLMRSTSEIGPAVVPGDPDASLLIIAVEHSGELRMPKGSDPLSAEEINILRQWITDGAVWE